MSSRTQFVGSQSWIRYMGHLVCLCLFQVHCLVGDLPTRSHPNAVPHRVDAAEKVPHDSRNDSADFARRGRHSRVLCWIRYQFGAHHSRIDHHTRRLRDPVSSLVCHLPSLENKARLVSLPNCCVKRYRVYVQEAS